MKRWIRLCSCLLLCGILAWMPSATVSAETGGDDASYTYTITLYAGNQGTFTDASAIQVDNSASGSSYTISGVEKDGSRIRITGLAYGDTVSVNVQACVSVTESAKYYVKGIRESGRDNDTVGSPAFQVKSDRDYVVAYGIQGDMVAYTVNYQDEDGNALLESSTYYGSVGDQPVIAFLYIENYQPQAYNLTKTLSSNEADNVFTFVYKQTDQNTSSTDTDSAAGTSDTNAAGGTADSNNGEGSNTASAEEEAEETDSENTEETPEELINLDDEDTPLSDMSSSGSDADSNARPAGMMPAFIAIAVIALAALLVLLMLVLRKKTRKAVNADEARSGKKEK